MKYKEYINSKQWKTLKQQVIINSGNKCAICDSRVNLVVHHLEYPDELGTETLGMLQCLCEDCHNIKCHNGSASNHKKNRLTKYEKNRLKKSRKAARYAGPVKIFTKEEIMSYT